MSRVHAILDRDRDGHYWLTTKGRNPTLVGGRELAREQRTEILPDQKIAICDFSSESNRSN